MHKPIKIILIQVFFIVLVLGVVYFIYPRVDVEVNGNFVRFNSINAKVVVISENPDFLNPRYIELDSKKKVGFNLVPGTYYWRSDNGIIEGLKHELKIESEVGLGVREDENGSNLVNIGNVRVNITEKEGGVMVGHIILGPDESHEIENKESKEYVGRQEK